MPSPQIFTSSAALALFLISSSSVSAAQDGPDYNTTVNFIIKHGTGIQNRDKSVVTEVERCTLRFASTYFPSKFNNDMNLTFTVDFNRPLVTESFDVPFRGVMAERLVKPGGLRNRFHFHLTDQFPMTERVVIHEVPKTVTIFNKGIHAALKGRKLKAGMKLQAPSRYMYWMIPGHKSEVVNKYAPLKKAIAHLIDLCGGVGATDFGAFGENTDENTERMEIE